VQPGQAGTASAQAGVTPTQAPPPTATATPTIASLPMSPTPKPAPTMTDFWNGLAQWVLQIPDTGLPVGESDTVDMGNGVLWSFLHASYQSAGVVDSCGNPVPFPGCVTKWVSTDGGQHFALSKPQCILRCNSCPCAEEDLVRQQQYPRVARSQQGMFYMLFEHDAETWLTTSYDGIDWTRPRLNPKTGEWHTSDAPCPPDMKIGPHPSFPVDYNCLAGGPPGIFVTPFRLFEYIGFGEDPAHLGCYWSWLSDVYTFFPCSANPQLTGAAEYGPLDAFGGAANPYFDFRYMTSADIIRQDEMYYMTYEGIRGPSSPSAGRDNQFALGFARSIVLNGLWEKYPGNPALQGVIDNWGIGHADLIVLNGVTYMYTGIPGNTRGRYALEYK